MAAKTRPVNVSEETQKRGLKLLEAHFPPGTAAWAFWSALAGSAMDAFEKGDIAILGIQAKSGGRPVSRNRTGTAPRGALPASQPEPAGVGANGSSNGSAEHAD